ILVASPKHRGKRPVARGSSAPVWPPFSARNNRRACCRAWFELRPAGLSSNSRPSSDRKTVRPTTRASVFGGRNGVLAQQLLDALALVHRIVVVEMQLGHVAHAHRLGQAMAQFG